MLTTDQLRAMGSSVVFAEERSKRSHGTKTASRSAKVFLSHSHKDKDLIEGGGMFLNKFKVTIYVDWLDDDMPETTNHATATKIKAKIAENSKFILLATPNALASKWVPWELGIADGLKGNDHVAILPVASPIHGWSGNEYVGMYPMIQETTTNGWAVFQPGATTGGIPLERWLVS
jgi:hypothetical protein